MSSRFARFGVKPAQMPALLRRIPHAAVGRGRHVVDARGLLHVERPGLQARREIEALRAHRDRRQSDARQRRRGQRAKRLAARANRQIAHA